MLKKTAVFRFKICLKNYCFPVSVNGSKNPTYEVSPILIITKYQVLKIMQRIIGFHRGHSVMVPGGAINNLYALIDACYKIGKMVE